MKIRALILCLALCAFFAGAISVAQFSNPATGSSQIVFSPSSAAVRPGSFISINYTVELISGDAGGGTSVSVVDGSYLSQHGITVQQTYSGLVYPTANGRLLVSVANTTGIQDYNITLQASGSDPSAASNFALAVKAAQSTTVPAAQTSQTTLQYTTALTSILATQSAPSISAGVVIIFLLVVAILFVGYLILKNQSKPRSSDDANAPPKSETAGGAEEKDGAVGDPALKEAATKELEGAKREFDGKKNYKAERTYAEDDASERLERKKPDMPESF